MSVHDVYKNYGGKKNPCAGEWVMLINFDKSLIYV